MTPDHEAAKKYANEWITDLDSRAKVRDILATTVGQFTASLIDEGDVISRAYLDLLAQRDEALALLRRVANWEHSSEPMHAVMGAARTFLAKTKGSQ